MPVFMLQVTIISGPRIVDVYSLAFENDAMSLPFLKARNSKTV